ncbi:MAG: hypothetical protein L0Z63_08965 [Actinobacteria bacterium]|nr:hypothetical protein [Actinomycetota bacterium]
MRLETVTIDFPEELIVDLHRRLDAVRWPEIGFDPGWDMGMDAATLRDLVHTGGTSTTGSLCRTS